MLFHLSLDANSNVGEMGEWREGTWRWSWRWRRELRDRELSMLNDLRVVVNSIFPKQEIPDSWKWRSKTKERYSTKGGIRGDNGIESGSGGRSKGGI